MHDVLHLMWSTPHCGHAKSSACMTFSTLCGLPHCMCLHVPCPHSIKDMAYHLGSSPLCFLPRQKYKRRSNSPCYFGLFCHLYCLFFYFLFISFYNNTIINLIYNGLQPKNIDLTTSITLFEEFLMLVYMLLESCICYWKLIS
jgi:hypothetical protein